MKKTTPETGRSNGAVKAAPNRQRRRKVRIKHSVLERLMRYYLSLQADGFLADSEWISSSQLAGHFNVDATQVRKDLACAGLEGKPRRGFRRQQVVERIRCLLGLNMNYNAVIVGAGRLGGAVASYADFRDYGLNVVGLFDSDPGKIGKKVGGCKVRPADELENYVASQGVHLAILTCPAEAAHARAEQLVRAGIRAIWNFSPTTLTVPRNVVVRNEHISVGLAEITYHLR